MKQILLVLVLIGYSYAATSQENDARFVVGLDFNHTPIVHNENYISTSYGIRFEIPKGDWSWSTSLLKQTLDKNSYAIDNHERGLRSIRSTRQSSQMIETTYGADLYNLIPTYAKIINRVQYRLSCNCMHLSVGYGAEVLVKEERIYTKSGTFRGSPQAAPRTGEIRKLTNSLELGFGTKFHFTEDLRLLFQPNYIIELDNRSPTDSFVYEDKYNYLQINIGLQYGVN